VPSTNPDRQREAEELRELCLTLIDFLCSVEGGLDASSVAVVRDSVEKAAARRQLTGLRMAKNDLVAMIQTIPGRQRARLDSMLREHVGISLDQLLAREHAQIRRIRDRGSIRTDTEYYLIREHVEMIWDDPTRSADVPALRTLLHEYEARAARRGRGGGGSPSAV
jgi:hypothetical protein